uniref:Uncharacterized protein n=1 Tax=Lygus hesperus TaxID=30085 RepID=A0A146L1A4_LYGHE
MGSKGIPALSPMSPTDFATGHGLQHELCLPLQLILLHPSEFGDPTQRSPPIHRALFNHFTFLTLSRRVEGKLFLKSPHHQVFITIPHRERTANRTHVNNPRRTHSISIRCDQARTVF